MAHRGIWLAATACLVAGVLTAPPGSGLENAGRSEVAGETSYLPSGLPTLGPPMPLPPPAPTVPVPATDLPPKPPAVPDLVAPAPRPTAERVTTVRVTRPTASRPDPKPDKPPKPRPPARPKPPPKPKPPTKPRPEIPLPRPGPPDITAATTWKGKLIAKTTPDGKTAISGTKPTTRG